MAGSSVNASANSGFEIDGCKYKAGGDVSFGTQVGYGGHYEVKRNKEEGIISLKMGAQVACLVGASGNFEVDIPLGKTYRKAKTVVADTRENVKEKV